MENRRLLLLSTLFLFSHPSLLVTHGQLLPIVSRCTNSGDRDIYIVHVKMPNNTKLLGSKAREKYYKSFLPPPIAPGQHRLVFSYNHAINGFAARLSEDEVKAMESMEGFVHAYRDREFSLHTTHSPDFLGLHPDRCFWKDSNLGQGVIIGVLDTGIIPSHPSFMDSGMPLPPSKWKGICDFDVNVCNNKLIGARGFSTGCRDSPADHDGHGTHTASIAAGSFVHGAAVLGHAKGTSAGMAPKAYLAIYKVCYETCLGSNILAGIDQAIADGVDVLSISIGSQPEPFYDDSMAIGTLAAVAKGIFVSSSAGNAGPRESSVENDAPWVLTVGASTMDRTIRATVKLGSGVEINGETMYQPENFPTIQLPLVYPGARGISRAKTCSEGSLDGINVRGKIVLCETGGSNTSIEKGAVVKKAGAVAMILVNLAQEMFTPEASAHVIPAAHVSYAAATKIRSYVKSSRTPTAAILFQGTWYGSPPSPTVAAFSGRGPSMINNGILKPDIIGPGVNIVAAWPSAVGPNPRNDSISTFNVLSGTSTAAPHLAGIAALLKVSHPDWSPAAIKSAIMTSSGTLNSDGKLIADETLKTTNYFSAGAGHVNPSKANDPGLIYDLTADDYIAYLCGLGYTDRQVSAIARSQIDCSSLMPVTAEELNYPTFLVSIGADSQKTVTRVVKNVGEANEAYSMQVDAPEGVEVTVYPDKLAFSAINQTAVYDVYFTTGDTNDRVGMVSEGQLRWVSGKHVVRSPISVNFI
ncbi:subtilisin-like protease SBT1.4 [Cocos nucifera]|uniref:Subtilisin-like protease SBT1.4 n=1 Tax=Cocos nucifera TaxID=13894 RepID=A0A8K0IEA3_COCNU|nr:subtilisin-like protease SBT1.4 [Cocos nucifera]